MKFLLFSLPGCYPCERAKKELRTHFSHVTTEHYVNRTEVASRYDVIYSPTLVILDDDGNVFGKLSGAHMIKKVEINGLISDFFNC